MCTICNVALGRNNKSNLCSKHYKEQWKLKNQDRETQNNRSYYDSNKEHVKTAVQAYYYNVRESAEYKAARAAKEARHRATKLNATPKWVNLADIRSIYESCPEGYHVDHIVPLNNKDVCGLHVPWNLRVIPAIDNLKKSNKLI